MQLDIGSMKIPVNAATKTFAILAKRGAGKSYTAAVVAEEFFRVGVPFVVFDPIDVWWGLRLSADGKSAGLPVVVFGARNADIPLTRDMGREIARAIVRDNVSCVISTYGMPKAAYRHLIAEFAEELLNINNVPRHVFIEEAHEFVPQRVFGAMSKTFSAVESLVVMGRNKGIGVTLINQRAATVNKDVLTQIDTLLAFRNVAPQDRKALQEWVEAHGAEGDFQKFMQSLPSLPTGEGWIWSPEFLGKFERIKIRKRNTFHPDNERIGKKFEVPAIGQSDIQRFIDQFPIEKEKGKKVTPKDWMGGEIKKGSVPHIDESIENAVRVVRNEYESKMIQKDVEIRRLTAIVQKVQYIVGDGGTVVFASAASDSVSLWQSKLGTSLAGRIFTFLSQNAGKTFTRQQICLAVGVSHSAGHTSNEFAKLGRNNLIVRQGDQYQINPQL